MTPDDSEETFNKFEAGMPTTGARSRAEAAIESLRSKGGIFVQAVRATRMPMAVTDPSLPGNPIVFVNEAFLQLSGYSMTEVLGQQPHFMNGRDTDAEDAARFQEALEKDCDAVIETVQYRKNGSRFTASVLLSAFKDPEGRTLNQFLSYLDVSRRVDSEQRAAASEASEVRFRALSEASSEVHYRMSADWGEMRELKGGGFLSDTSDPSRAWLLKYIPDCEHARVNAAIDEAIRDKRVFELEHRVLQSDGSEGWTSSRAVPVLGADGEILEWFGAASDITARKQAETALKESEERQAFLLKLSDALRPLVDPVAIMAAASEMLGRYLKAGRCGYGEVDESGEYFTVERDWTDGVMASFAGSHRLVDFGPDFVAAYRSGRTVRIDDPLADTRAAGAEAAFEAAGGVRASLGLPLIKDGRFVAGLFVQQTSPRVWSATDEAVTREVADRTWAAVERARADRRLRTSEEKYRTIFNSVEDGFCVIEVIEDKDGNPVDLLHLEVNPAYERHTGLRDIVGKRALDVTPDAAAWLSFYGDVARNGHAARIEYHVEIIGRWFACHASRLGGEGSRKVAVVFDDITERKRAEMALRESEERQAFLLALSDALRAEPNADAIAERAIRMLSEQLRLDLCYLATYRLEQDRADITHQTGNDRLPPMPESIRLSDFPEAFRVVFDRTLVIEDVLRDERLSDVDKQSIRSLGMGALVAPTLRKGAHRPLRALVAVSAEPRRWTRGEVTLLEDVAERSWAAVERAQAEAALRQSEERFRSFAENSDDTLWIVDAATRQLEYLSPAYESMWGESRAEVLADLGRWTELVHPDDREKALKGMPSLFSGHSVQQEYRIIRPTDGSVRWIQDTGFPIRDEQGRLTRVGGVAQDVTGRKKTERVVSDSRRALRELIEGIPQLVWRAIDGGKWIWASPQWTAFTGLSNEASAGWGWLDAIHPDDQDAISAAWEQANGERSVLDIECRIAECGGGGYRWFAIRARPLDPSLDDEHLEWLGTSTDIHDMRRLQEQQKVLVRELHHRTRNLMAVVASIARQSAARAGDLRAFLPAFDQRLSALSRVQDLLTRSDDEPIAIGTLLRLELEALAADVDEGRVSLIGPEVLVPRGSTQMLALAFHELATNARKYGALASSDGRLDIHWVVGERKEGRSIVLEWIEEGRASAPLSGSTSGGYGRQLIERALPRVLGAETRFELGEHGVRCMIALPL